MNAALFDYLELCRRMLDARRIELFDRVLSSVVPPESTVVDIGTGLGVVALLACRHGARKVYAIDSRPMIHLAREVAAANGFAERIEFIHGDSRFIALPEQGDVVVVDVRSVLPEFQVPVTLAARRRLLAPGGVLVPRADTLWGAVVQSPERYEELVGIWAHHPQGFAADVARRRSAHTWIAQRIRPDELISEPVRWATIDYQTATDTDIAGSFEAIVVSQSVGHGLTVWFESELAPGIAMSGRPEGRADDYGTAFFPWPEIQALDKGDRVAVSFHGRLQPGGYQWRWQTAISSSTGQLKSRFDQDTARAYEHDEPAAPTESAATARESVRIDRFALAQMERGITIETIAAELLDRFPSAFSDQRAALTHVGALSARYG